MAMIFDISIFNSSILVLLSILYFGIVIATILTIVLDNGDPVKTLSWIVVIILIPVIGFVLYIIFGQNYRKRKIFSRKEIVDTLQINSIVSKQLYHVNSILIEDLQEVKQNREIITLLLNNNKSPLTYYNDVTILNNGEETYKSIKAALKEAKDSIHLEYYIICDDKIGNEIADILIEKARSGVQARVIYDDVGSWELTSLYIKKLRMAGVMIESFMPVRFPMFTSKINYRNHRKIIVIDGKTAFTGGLNIADRYIEGVKNLGMWRDTHLKIVGKAVHSLQALFINDWYFVSDEKLKSHKRYFPKIELKTLQPVQIASSGPDSDWASIMQAHFSAITKATNNIYISTPYFLPTTPILTAIKVAALSGVDVRIMLPNKSDSKMTYWATRSYIGELLEAGVKIFLYCKGFNHSKLLLIDGKFSSVGTANMDVRSFDANFEVSAMIYDKHKCDELESMFILDLEDCYQVNTEYWAGRHRLHTLYEGTARLLTPLL